MLLKCFVVVTAIQILSVVSVTTDLYAKGKSSKAQRKKNMNPDVISSSHRVLPAPEINGADIDKAKTIYENYFPDVIYPTSILDIAEPFYYKDNEYDKVLAPFSDDVKLSYKTITSNGNKINNKITTTKIIEDDKIRDAMIPISTIHKENHDIFHEEQQETGNSTQNSEVLLSDLLAEEMTTNAENNSTTFQKEVLEHTSAHDDYFLVSNINNNGIKSEENNKNIQNVSVENQEQNQTQYTDYEIINSDVSTIVDDEISTQILNIKNDSEPLKRKAGEILSETPIQIKINIEIFKTVSEKQKEIDENLNILPEEILEHDPSKVNKIDSEQRVKNNSNNDSLEEINTFSQPKNKLLNYLNNTNFNNSTALISISSNDNDILLQILQLLDEKLLSKSKIETVYNKINDPSHIETVEIFFKNDNNTSDIQSVDNEELKDKEDDFFLDFIISLDTFCEMNETQMAKNSNDTTK